MSPIMAAAKESRLRLKRLQSVVLRFRTGFGRFGRAAKRLLEPRLRLILGTRIPNIRGLPQDSEDFSEGAGSGSDLTSWLRPVGRGTASAVPSVGAQSSGAQSVSSRSRPRPF